MTHVLVVSDRRLVAESVAAALSALGLLAVPGDWPEGETGMSSDLLADPEPYDVTAPPSTGAAGGPDVGVLVSDLDPTVHLGQALRVLHSVATRWVVLTEAPRGPLWGAVLDVGAVAVLEDKARLEDIAGTIRAMVAEVEVMSREEVKQLRHSWRAVRSEQRMLVDRMRRLSPRETVVLGMLYSGEPVWAIAEQLGVSEATVRSQVRAVLRKLDVNSQLAAVAAYAAVRQGLVGS